MPPSVVLIIGEFLLLFLTSQFVVSSLGLALYRITRSQKITISLFALLFFPGVVVHELSHMLVAGVLFVPIHEVEFLPEIQGSSVKLGSVKVGQSDLIRRFLIGVAPFLLGSMVMLLVVWYGGKLLSEGNIFSHGRFFIPSVLLYAVFVMSNTMFSSRKDLEGTLEFFLCVLILGIAWFLINKNSILLLGQYLLSQQVSLFLQPIALLLLIPLGINMVLAVLCYSINRR